MTAACVRLIQRSLIDEGLNPGTVDGKPGDNTYRAVNAALTKRAAGLPGDWQGWSNPRKTVAYLQFLCEERNLDVGDIDGLWGPQTEYAVDSLTRLLETGELPRPWRDETPLSVNPNGWPAQNEATLIKFYGHVETNQVSLVLPYPHRVAWDLRQTVTAFSCNAKVHDSAKRVLQRVFDLACRDGIETRSGFVEQDDFRLQRQYAREAHALLLSAG